MPPRWLSSIMSLPRGREAPSGAAARRRACRGDKPLGMDDGDGQHHDASDLVQQRQRQRRLIQQRDDADAGLQGDGAEQRQRAVGTRRRAARAGIDGMQHRPSQIA